MGITWMMMGMKACKRATYEASPESCMWITHEAGGGDIHVYGSRHVLIEILQGGLPGPYPVANRGWCKDFSIATPLARATFGTNNVSRGPGTGS